MGENVTVPVRSPLAGYVAKNGIYAVKCHIIGHFDRQWAVFSLAMYFYILDQPKSARIGALTTAWTTAHRLLNYPGVCLSTVLEIKNHLKVISH